MRGRPRRRCGGTAQPTHDAELFQRREEWEPEPSERLTTKLAEARRISGTENVMLRTMVMCAVLIMVAAAMRRTSKRLSQLDRARQFGEVR
jgi:hypothetical protein